MNEDAILRLETGSEDEALTLLLDFNAKVGGCGPGKSWFVRQFE
jgi:hypothetical protein